MHFRVLGSVLARRFTPRGFPRTQAQAASSPWMVSRRAAIWATAAIPARPLHSVRDLVVADGSNGGVFMAAFTGLAGFIYLSQIYKDESAAEDTGKVTPGVETRKEVEKMPAVEVFKDEDMDDAAIRSMFMNEDGSMRWLEYIDYLTFGKTFGGAKAVDMEDAGVEHKETQEDDTVDEAAMTARFEEWMKKHEKTYRSMEEKAMRYENFKKTDKRAAKFNASKGSSFQPNGLADLSLEECDGIYDSTPRGDRYWEEYVALLKSIKAQMKEGKPYILCVKTKDNTVEKRQEAARREEAERHQEAHRRD
ncbi:hypothetical protein QOZ80_6BG0473500 [Eleusine coracana subsp. coracana]|nr:hypothetical protein QOZ80_6BG0473500 [Eleusine coracana subsp. coracana]